MRWVLKAGLQKGLSALPGGESANYVLQRYVTHSLPVSDTAFRGRFGRAAAHFAAYLEHGPSRNVGEAVFYEFGAGWDLVVPIAYWSLGVGRQILVDIRSNIRLELVNESMRRLARLRPELEEKAGLRLRDPCGAAVGSLRQLEERLGIRYLAPRDARETGLASRSVDFVSSTSTLEHVPVADLVAILRECRRLLRPDGAMSSRIDLRDHYSYFDSGISQYNFLRFGGRTWRLLNSSLHYQSRLRWTDYLEAFSAAGFVVVTEDAVRPGEHQLARLRELRPAASFRRYPLEDLEVTALALVAKPAPSPDAA